MIIDTKDFGYFTLLENETDWLSFKDSYRPGYSPTPSSYPCFVCAKYMVEMDFADWWDIYFLYEDEIFEMVETLQDLKAKKIHDEAESHGIDMDDDMEES